MYVSGCHFQEQVGWEPDQLTPRQGPRLTSSASGSRGTWPGHLTPNYPPAFQTMLAMLVAFFFCGYMVGDELVAGGIYTLKGKLSVEGSPVRYLGFLFE